MMFNETVLKGAFIIEPEKLEDNRGFFARAFCQKEFRARGLIARCVQCNIAYNKMKGTLRGMHYQQAPCAEAKLVRCTSGAIYDVIIDLRSDSPTYRKWIGVMLTAQDRRMIYVPEGFAHGYQALADNTEVFYQVSRHYSPRHEGGIRWNDPAFSIEWPPKMPVILSAKDRSWPDYPR